MRVVIRLRTASETSVVPDRRPNRRLAGSAASVLAAAAFAGFSVSVWRWGNDLQMFESFPFADGVFSRWQLWFGLGLLLQTLSAALANYGRGVGRENERRGEPQPS